MGGIGDRASTDSDAANTGPTRGVPALDQPGRGGIRRVLPVIRTGWHLQSHKDNHSVIGANAVDTRYLGAQYVGGRPGRAMAGWLRDPWQLLSNLCHTDHLRCTTYVRVDNGG